MSRFEMTSGDQARSRFLSEAMPHMQALYRMALNLARDRDAAEDLVQDTYQVAWQSFHGYAPETDCKAWLFRILFRRWKRSLRQSYRMKPVDIDTVEEEILAGEPDPQRQMEGQDVVRVVYSLPEHYRAVLVLVDVEGFSYREVSGILGLPLGTVMSRLNRARGLFRDKFTREGQDTRSA